MENTPKEKLKTVSTNKALKITNDVTIFKGKDESIIKSLDVAKEYAEIIANNPIFNAPFEIEDEDGKKIISKEAIVNCLMLGGEMGLSAMKSLTFGRMLNRHAVIKAEVGRGLGLGVISSLRNIYIWPGSGGNEIIYTGIHVVTAVLNKNNIEIIPIEENIIHYDYKIAAGELKGEEIGYNEENPSHREKYVVFNEGRSKEYIKSKMDTGAIPILRYKTRRSKYKLVRRNQSIAIPYTLQDATDAGLYQGINSRTGEDVKGKDNWNNHPAAHLRKMTIILGARVIASDLLNGIYVDGEIGVTTVMTDEEIQTKYGSDIEEVEVEEIDSSSINETMKE